MISDISTSKYSVLDLGFNALLTREPTTADSVTPEMQNAITHALAARNLNSGEVISTLEQQTGAVFSGKTAFTNTDAGYRLGVENGIAKFYIGNSTDYLNWTGTVLTIAGSITATSGYFGSATNGVQINSSGLQIIGTGYIGTDVSPNSRILMTKSTSGGYTDGLTAYNSSNVLLFRLITSASPKLTMFSDGDGNAQFLGHASISDFNVKVTTLGTDDGLRVEMSGTKSTSTAGLRVNMASTLGQGLTIVRTNGNTGDGILFSPDGSTKLANILRISNPGSGLTATLHESRITEQAYIQFPAYHHCSDFDEALGGASLALASSVIAKAYWVGGGTSGTQTLVADSTADQNTYINLSTTATGSRSSSIIFSRFIPIDQRSVEFRIFVSSKTNTNQSFGFYDGSANYAWFNFDTAVNADNIYAECYNGTLTRTDTGVDITTGTWVTFRIIQFAGPFTYFYINDTLVATIQTNTDTNPMKPYIFVNNKASAEEKIIYVDYVKVWKGRNDTVTP